MSIFKLNILIKHIANTRIEYKIIFLPSSTEAFIGSAIILRLFDAVTESNDLS